MDPSRAQHLQAYTSQSELDHLLTVPWCAALLADTSLTPIFNAGRVAKPSTQDALLGQVLNTEETIRASTSFSKAHSPTNTEIPRHAKEPTRGAISVEPAIDTNSRPPSSQSVYTISSLGPLLASHPNLIHGGMISLLLDEITGLAVGYHIPNAAEAARTYTAYLHTTYKKPLSLPNFTLSRATVYRTEGRKIFVKGTIEDGTGEVYASGDALFITMRAMM